MKFAATVRAITACTLIGGWLLSACSPVFNWREVRPTDADGLVAWFPCKPDVAQREMAWPGVSKATVTVMSCRADDAIWALRYVRLSDALQLSPTLAWWNDDLVQRVGYAVTPLPPLTVPGMTPQPESKSWRLTAREGQKSAEVSVPLSGAAWHFSHGLVVFQASVWRPAPYENSANGEDVVSTFQKGFHFPG